MKMGFDAQTKNFRIRGVQVAEYDVSMQAGQDPFADSPKMDQNLFYVYAEDQLEPVREDSWSQKTNVKTQKVNQ